MRFFVPLGPGYFLHRVIALQKGRVRRFRDGRKDIWFVAPLPEERAYARARGAELLKPGNTGRVNRRTTR